MANRVRRLWAVTTGEYSDYRVNAVFEREEDARAFIDSGFGSDSYGADVTEMPYVPAGVRPRRLTVHCTSATAYRRGKLGDVAVRTYSEVVWDLGDNPAPRRPRVWENRWADGSAVSVNAACSNPTLAEKAVRDRLARLYAEWEGIA